MSDNNSQTDNPNNQNDQSAPLQGGWRQPEQFGGWKAPVKKQETGNTGGWRVPAIPKELDEEPQDTGGWHRPQSEQTIYSEDDEIEVISPSDELLELAKNVSFESGSRPADTTSAPAPEDQLFALASETASDMEAPQSPEDLMALLDVIEDSEELSETAGVRSELFALASLVDDAPASDEMIEEQEDDELDDYSPGLAEQALQQEGEGVVDPGDYARNLLAELDDEPIDSAEAFGSVGDISDTGGADPADYARSLLEELEGDPFGGTSATPPPVDTAPIDPRQEELARRFRETEEEVHALRDRMRRGEINNDQYKQMLSEHMILDDDQVYWVMAEDSDQWFKYINDAWVPAEPPRSQASSQLPSAAAYGFEEYALPSEDIPTNDPNMTQLSGNFFDNTMAAQDQAFNFDIAEETAPASAAAYGTAQDVGGTMAYGALADDAGIESAVDLSEPPDVESEQETPLADEARERQQSRMLSGAIFAVLILVGILALLGVGIFFLASSWYSGVIAKYENQIVGLQDYTPEFQAVRLLDARGELITVISRDGEERITVRLQDIAPLQIHAIVSAENPTFYQDPGWSFTDSLSGFFSSLGGDIPTIQRPTITEQIARNLIVGSGGDQSNLETTAVAGELTNRYSKDFLLELYLNETFFGNQSYGVESAAQFYFEETSGSVNLPQSALIAGLIDDPVAFDPVTNREGSFARMEQVMDAMVATGCLNMTHGPGQVCVRQSDREIPEVIFANSQVRIREYEPRTFDVPYPHFVSLVRAQLEASVPDLWSMGLVVRTTLSPSIQERMETSLARRVEDLRDAGVSTGAIMWTDPDTGAIRGYVGSPDYGNEEVNGSTDFARQYLKPGQTIMPIVYAGALDGVDKNGNGGLDQNEYYTAATVTWNVPTQLPDPNNPNVLKTVPMSGTTGSAPVRQALQSLYYAPAAEAYEFIGRDKFVSTANGMGDLYTKVDPNFSWESAIGETAVRLNDMMTAYGTIASGGIRRSVYAIESIEDGSGNVLAVGEQLQHVEERVLPDGVAFLLQNIMSDDASRDVSIFGNPSQMVANGLDRSNHVGASMGSPLDKSGFWTIGFTQDAVVGVWLGRHDGGSIPNETARTAAVPLWNEVMSLIVTTARNEGNAPGQFGRPSSIAVQTICPDTGSENSSCAVSQRNEFFAQTRRAPDQTLVTNAAINTWTRLLANEFCSNQQDTVVQTFANISNPYAVDWLRNTPQGQNYAARIGLQPGFTQLPTGSCDQNTRLPTANISQPANNQQIMGNIAILGQVSADNFNRYQIEYSIAGQNAYSLLPGMPSNAQQPNPGSQLATWDTQTVVDSLYDLRLAVFSNDGGYVFRPIQVNIDNPDPTATPTPIPTFTPIPQLPTTTPIPLDNVPTLDPNFGNSQSVPTFTPDPF